MLTVDPFCGIHMSIVEPSGIFSVTGEVTHSWTLRGWLSLLATPYLLLRKVGQFVTIDDNLPKARALIKLDWFILKHVNVKKR